MRKILALALLCTIVSALSAQESPKPKKILTNADIVLMTQDHFDDDTLIQVIKVSQTDFDISGDALVKLKDEGVSTAVIRAMLQAAENNKRANAAAPAEISAAPAIAPAASTPATPAEPAAAPAPSTPAEAPTPAAPAVPPNAFAGMQGMNPQQMAAMQAQLSSMGMGGMLSGMMGTSFSPEKMPHVFLMGDGEGKPKSEITSSTAQIGQTKMKGGVSPGGMALRSLATEGLSFAAMGAGPAGMMAMSAFSMASGFMPGMRPGAPKMSYVWGLPGRKSPREIADINPMFELNYGDIPGVDPDGYEPVLIELFPTKDNYRLVGATQTTMDTKHMMSGGGPEGGKWVSEERWPTRLDKEERGFYILHVEKPLDPGEYAVVLRPAKHYNSGPSMFGGGAQVFYSVWDFSVPGTPPASAGKKK